MNKVILTGRLVKDIELKYTANERAMINNSIAVKREFKNANGEYDTDFVNITIWGNQAEYVNNYIKKGNMVCISGKIQTRNYENEDGQKVYITEVVVETIENLTPRETIQEVNEMLDKEESKPDPFLEMKEIVESDISDDDFPF